jgi:hypothetical protein
MVLHIHGVKKSVNHKTDMSVFILFWQEPGAFYLKNILEKKGREE